MPKVNFVKSARKANPVAQVGESYYWWQNFKRPKQYSKTYPKPSQTVGSSFLQQFYSLGETMAERFVSLDTFEDERDNLVGDIQELLDECQSSLDNMPEHLQDTSDAGTTLTERIGELEDLIFNLEGMDVPDPEDIPKEVDEDGDAVDTHDSELKRLVEEIENFWPGL